MKKILKNKKGFTLIELMVVIVIILILAAIAIPSFTRLISQANEAQATAEGRTVYLLMQLEADSANIDGDDATAAITSAFSDICDDAGVDSDSISTWEVDADGKVTMTYEGIDFPLD